MVHVIWGDGKLVAHPGGCFVPELCSFVRVVTARSQPAASNCDLSAGCSSYCQSATTVSSSSVSHRLGGNLWSDGYRSVGNTSRTCAAGPEAWRKPTRLRTH